MQYTPHTIHDFLSHVGFILYKASNKCAVARSSVPRHSLHGTLLASPVVHGVTGHLSICMWNLWVFLDDAPGCHCPFVLCLDPQDCLRVVCKGFPTFPANLRMRPVSRGYSRHSLVDGDTCRKTPIPWSALDKNPMAEPNSKAILWIKAQHEGAVTPWCIVQKNPQVPHYKLFFETTQAILGNKKQNNYSVNGHVVFLQIVLMLLNIWKKRCLLFRKIFSLETSF